MSQEVASLLAKLDAAMGKKKSAQKIDWAEAKKAFWKPKDGKNQIAVITPEGLSDPFVSWGYHKGLQEVEYYSVPCDKMNKDEHCVICEVVDQLKAENWEGNKHLWMPIEQKIDTYAPIIDLSSAATIAEGAKWMRVSKTIMLQMIESLKILEEGEVPFFDLENPQRLIISYDKTQAPASQYNVSFKDMKDKDIIAKMVEASHNIRPVGDFIFSKSQDSNKKLVEEYFARISNVLEESMDKQPSDSTDAAEKAAPKLGGMKR